MKNQIKIRLFLSIFCLFASHQLFSWKRVINPNTGEEGFIGYVRPNSKSSLRYIAFTPDRTRQKRKYFSKKFTCKQSSLLNTRLKQSAYPKN